MTFLRKDCEHIILNTEHKPFFVNEFMDKEGLLALYYELQYELFPDNNDLAYQACPGNVVYGFEGELWCKECDCQLITSVGLCKMACPKCGVSYTRYRGGRIDETS